MIVVRTFKDNTGQFSNITTAVSFENCKRRLKLYFSDLERVRRRIANGETINVPYITLQKDRRRENISVTDERRKPISKSII